MIAIASVSATISGNNKSLKEKVLVKDPQRAAQTLFLTHPPHQKKIFFFHKQNHKTLIKTHADLPMAGVKFLKSMVDVVQEKGEYVITDHLENLAMHQLKK